MQQMEFQRFQRQALNTQLPGKKVLDELLVTDYQLPNFSRVDITLVEPSRAISGRNLRAIC